MGDGALVNLCSNYLSYLYFFFFNDTATTEIYTLSLHDALPIFQNRDYARRVLAGRCFGREFDSRRLHQPAGAWSESVGQVRIQAAKASPSGILWRASGSRSRPYVGNAQRKAGGHCSGRYGSAQGWRLLSARSVACALIRRPDRRGPGPSWTGGGWAKKPRPPPNSSKKKRHPPAGRPPP